MRRLLIALALALLGATATLAATAPAEAQTGHYWCEAGQLIGDQCAIVGPAPNVEYGCADNQSIVEFDDGCFYLAAPTPRCDAPYRVEGSRCLWEPPAGLIGAPPIESDADCPTAPGARVAWSWTGFVFETTGCSADPVLECAPPFERFERAGTVYCRLKVADAVLYTCPAPYELDGLLRCVRLVPAQIQFDGGFGSGGGVWFP